jgi:hypothetical protein
MNTLLLMGSSSGTDLPLSHMHSGLDHCPTSQFLTPDIYTSGSCGHRSHIANSLDTMKASR